MEKEKYLFIIDLDGTTLKDSVTCEIHPKTLKGIKKLKDEGHIVCISTGRPWRSVKPIYQQLGLDTAIANHNGAHIHHPVSDTFVSRLEYIELNVLMYILGDKKLKALIKNYAIQGIEWVQLLKKDKSLESMFGFNTLSKYHIGINLTKIPMNPIGVIIDVNDNVDVVRLGDYLKRKYGDLANFSHWPRDKGKTPIFEISPFGAKKNVALSYLSRFYHIKNKNTIAIGDGWNDIEMFKVAGVSVAMKNALDNVKKYASHVTSLSNSEGGVGNFIDKFLDNPDVYLTKGRDSKITFTNKKQLGGYH